MNRRVVLIGVGILLACIGAGLFLSRDAIATWLTLSGAPEEVQNMVFLTGPEDAKGIARIKGGFFKTQYFAGKSVMEVTKGTDTLFALLKDTATGSVDVFEITWKGDMRALTTDGTKKRDIAVSADGRYLAWSTEGAPREGTTAAEYDVRRLTLSVLTTETGTIAELGNGAHPVFLADGKLFFTSTRGYVLRDMVTGDEGAIADESSFLMVAIPASSETGQFVAENIVSRAYDVFSVGGDTLPNISPVQSIPFESITDMAFGEDGTALYALAGNRIDWYLLPDGAPQTVFRIPAGISITDIEI